ncbi:latrophilin-like protein LAT-2 isoform X1 [Halichondria panicea]|uniref:latrophilin-like protein LAT-2 isoform X1 n=1 Tax=Halichondria panicea TaxID=6063 RepID=UPI00312B4D17
MTRTCQANGTWTGTVQICDPVNCGDLTDPTNGAVNTSSGTTFNMNATYTCNTGYNLNGITPRTCQATNETWSGSEPTCEIVTCSILPAPTNGMVDEPRNTFGSNATYTCDTGYTLNGDTTRTCGNDGSWSGSEPTCNFVDCGPLTGPSNGLVTVTITTFRGTAVYTCNNGYNLTGDMTRTCQANGTWTGTVQICDPVNCGDLTDPTNGAVNTSSGTTFNMNATYTCNTGYNLIGITPRTCQATNETWSGSEPTCEIVDCGAPPTIFDGSRTLAGTTFGEMATYTCTTSGFSIFGSATITCQANGSWEPEPACTMGPIDCGPPPSVSNGSPGAPSPDTMLDGMVTYTCDTGYEVSTGVTTATATCMANRVWETVPTCQRVVCEAEQDSVWGLVFPTTLAGFSYSQQCPQNGNGTTLGTATRFCTLGGVWEAVNTDNCTREVIISLNNTANELFSRNASQNNASQNEVDNLLVSLAEATSVNATGGSTIFPQDLSTTNLIVKSSVNYLIQNVETASPMSSLNFSEEVMNVLNNVLDERNTGGWERLQEDSSAESQQLLLSAELYGQYVSSALRSEGVDTGNVTEITLMRQNIVLAAMEVDTTSLDNIIFPEVVKVSEETGSAQTVIPATLLAERGALEGGVTAVNILFSNLEDFLPKTNLGMNTTRPVSQVISSQVFSNVKLNNFQTKATFRFTTQKFSEDEVAENAKCVFWSVSSDAANSMWSTEGVTTVSVDEDSQMRVYNIVCESSHFTAFAVLMDVTGALNDTTAEIRFALSVVTYVGCSISIFFLLLSIVYFLTLRRELLTKVHNFIHFNLSISLLLGYVVFLSGVETAVANKGACVFVAVLLHYLFTTVFFWMLCEGIMLYLMLVLVFSQISKKWWIFFIIGWVVPVIPVAISAALIHDQYGTEEYCWIAVGAGDKGAIWAFVVPMLLVVLVNIFFLLAALRSVYRRESQPCNEVEKRNLYSYSHNSSRPP